MGLEEYQIALIVIIAVFAVIATIVTILKKRRQAKLNQTEIREVSTIQSVYYEPAKYTQYPPPQNTDTTIDASAPRMPGWNLTNLDAPSSSVNIRHPESGVVIQRDPVMFPQSGYPPYPVYPPNTTPQQGYGVPPPYYPTYPHSSNAAQ